MMIIHYLAILLHVFGVPHTKISFVSQELKSKGFKSIHSDNNFENSLTCEACAVTIRYAKISQAIWLLKRHTKETAHQLKAGWFLDDFGNIKESKPKGKWKINCNWPTWSFSKFMVFTIPSIMLAEGRPLEALYMVSREASCALSNTFLLFFSGGSSVDFPALVLLLLSTNKNKEFN